MRQISKSRLFLIKHADFEVSIIKFYQPEASLEMFRRVLLGLDIADGDLKISANYSSSGLVNATHAELFVALPSTRS